MDIGALHAGEVHVWQLGLDAEADHVAQLAALLSEDELNKAAGFRAPLDRAHFQVAHGRVRQILAEYLSVPSREIRFETNQWGKPRIVCPVDCALHFNLAHSHRQMLLAVCRREVGVDIEHMRSGIDARGIAENYFSVEEIAVLGQAQDIGATFLRCWTAKEAVIKGVGMGLSLPLASFVTLADDQTLMRKVRVSPDGGTAADFHLYALDTGPEYFGALAVHADSGSTWRVIHRTRS